MEILSPFLFHFLFHSAEITHSLQHMLELGMRMEINKGLALWTEQITDENLTLGGMAVFVEILKRLN